MQKTHTEATTDFSAFYKTWSPKVQTAVHQAGFSGPDADDLVADIFTDLYRGGYLDKYDPQKGSFSTYIWGHVRVRILGRRRLLWKRGQRETIQDMSDPMFDRPDNGQSLKETELNILLEDVYQELATLPATQSKNLARLFKDIVKAIMTEGEFSQTELAKKYQLSRQAISYQVKDLAQTEAMQRFLEAVHIG